MEKHDLTLISKKRRIDFATTGDIPNLKGEGVSMVAESASASNIFADSLVYRLFFKGLVSDETTTDMEEIVKAGFGIAICDEANTLLYNMKKSLNGDDVINPEEVEIKALICVLNVSIQMELRNVMICCGDYQIFQIVSVIFFFCYFFFCQQLIYFLCIWVVQVDIVI